MEVKQISGNSPRGKNTKTVICMRCGVCLRACSHNLSPVFIKEAFGKNMVGKLKELRADLCNGCGQCTYVCPSRIDLRGSVLRAKALIR